MAEAVIHAFEFIHANREQSALARIGREYRLHSDAKRGRIEQIRHRIMARGPFEHGYCGLHLGQQAVAGVGHIAQFAFAQRQRDGLEIVGRKFIERGA
jgi:hypothetical protein